MRRILLALGQVLSKSFLILSLMIVLLSSLLIFVQSPSYAVEGINEMVKPQEKVRQTPHGAEKKSPFDVEAEEVKKGVVEEGKVMRDLVTGKKPSGKSVFDSDGK